MPIHRSHRFGRSLGRNYLSDSVSVNSVFSAASVLIPIRCSTFNCGSKIPTLSGLSTSFAPLFHGSPNTPVTAIPEVASAIINPKRGIFRYD